VPDITKDRSTSAGSRKSSAPAICCHRGSQRTWLNVLNIGERSDRERYPSNYISHLQIPNVVMVPIADKEANWDVFVVLQRGKSRRPLARAAGCAHSLNPAALL